MRWVPVAANRPQRCAAIPFISSHHEKGFIDTGAILPGWDPHVYVSVIAVEEMARMIGWGPAVTQPEPPGEIVELKELEAERDALREQLAAVEVLKQNGFQQARKPGRPRKAGV